MSGQRSSIDDFDLRLVELTVATADGAGPAAEGALTQVLHLIREHLRMDVVFVSEFVGDRAVFRRVEAQPENRVVQEGESYALADTYCQRVIDGRLPPLVPDVPALAQVADVPPTAFPVGAYLAVPVRLQDGRICGMLCCFSFAADESLTERDLRRLEMAARLAARVIEEVGSANPVPDDPAALG